MEINDEQMVNKFQIEKKAQLLDQDEKDNEEQQKTNKFNNKILFR